MSYVLGIDHGNTKTAAVVANDDGVICGYACVKNHDLNIPCTDAVAYTISVVREAYGRALLNAGLQINDVDMVTGGLTGADWPEEYNVLKDALIRASGITDVMVYNDCIPAFFGHIGRPYGAVICSGSGLNVGIVGPDGETEALGWYIDADSSGASALGRRAIRAVIASDVGVAEPTALKTHILRAFNYRSVEELLRGYIAGTLPDVRRLAPCVFDAAEEGDGAAAGIITDCAVWAARYAITLLRRHNMLERDPDIVLSGSVLKNKFGLMREKIAELIYEKCPQARVEDAVYEPVVGAAIMALQRKAGSTLGEKIKANIRASCDKHGLLREIGRATNIYGYPHM